jgi:uncharacterized protein YjiS (DUF1127 family)
MTAPSFRGATGIRSFTMANFFGSLRQAWRMKSTRLELSRLSDAQLRDIGIHRGQIEDFTRSMTGGTMRPSSF